MQLIQYMWYDINHNKNRQSHVSCTHAIRYLVLALGNPATPPSTCSQGWLENLLQITAAGSTPSPVGLIIMWQWHRSQIWRAVKHRLSQFSWSHVQMFDDWPPMIIPSPLQALPRRLASCRCLNSPQPQSWVKSLNWCLNPQPQWSLTTQMDFFSTSLEFPPRRTINPESRNSQRGSQLSFLSHHSVSFTQFHVMRSAFKACAMTWQRPLEV